EQNRPELLVGGVLLQAFLNQLDRIIVTSLRPIEVAEVDIRVLAVVAGVHRQFERARSLLLSPGIQQGVSLVGVCVAGIGENERSVLEVLVRRVVLRIILLARLERIEALLKLVVV